MQFAYLYLDVIQDCFDGPESDERSISFLSNASITSIVHDMPGKISTLPGTLITIPANEPTSNYGRFMSWNAKSDGS